MIASSVVSTLTRGLFSRQELTQVPPADGLSPRQFERITEITVGDQLTHDDLKSLMDRDTPQCCVCIEGFNDGERVRVLPCNHQHMFHTACIWGWVKDHHECPICRRDLKALVEMTGSPRGGVDWQETPRSARTARVDPASDGACRRARSRPPEWYLEWLRGLGAVGRCRRIGALSGQSIAEGERCEGLPDAGSAGDSHGGRENWDEGAAAGGVPEPGPSGLPKRISAGVLVACKLTDAKLPAAAAPERNASEVAGRSMRSADCQRAQSEVARFDNEDKVKWELRPGVVPERECSGLGPALCGLYPPGDAGGIWGPPTRLPDVNARADKGSPSPKLFQKCLTSPWSPGSSESPSTSGCSTLSSLDPVVSGPPIGSFNKVVGPSAAASEDGIESIERPVATPPPENLHPQRSLVTDAQRGVGVCGGRGPSALCSRGAEDCGKGFNAWAAGDDSITGFCVLSMPQTNPAGAQGAHGGTCAGEN